MDAPTLRFPSRKLVSEVLDFHVDLTARLNSGEGITSVSWTVPTGMVKNSNSLAGKIATVWLSAGIPGKNVLTLVAQTDQARTISERIVLMVEEG